MTRSAAIRLAEFGTIGAAEFVGLEPHDRLLRSELLRQRRRDEVDLVVLRDAGHQFGSFDPGGTQRRRVRATTDHGLHVEFVTERPCDHLVLLDHDDVVVLRTESLSEIPPDFSGSDDHDMHRCTTLVAR